MEKDIVLKEFALKELVGLKRYYYEIYKKNIRDLGDNFTENQEEFVKLYETFTNYLAKEIGVIRPLTCSCGKFYPIYKNEIVEEKYERYFICPICENKNIYFSIRIE